MANVPLWRRRRLCSMLPPSRASLFPPFLSLSFFLSLVSRLGSLSLFPHCNAPRQPTLSPSYLSSAAVAAAAADIISGRRAKPPQCAWHCSCLLRAQASFRGLLTQHCPSFCVVEWEWEMNMIPNRRTLPLQIIRWEFLLPLRQINNIVVLSRIRG